MRNLNLLAEQIRADSIASGWNPIMLHEWVTSDYKVPGLLALIGSEICEAYAQTGSDGNDPFLAAEFADILIRTLDLAGGLTTDFMFYVTTADGSWVARIESPDVAFLELNQLVTNALETFRRDNKQRFLEALGELYRSTVNIAEHFYLININKAIDNKMAVNRQRKRRNGGKRV